MMNIGLYDITVTSIDSSIREDTTSIDPMFNDLQMHFTMIGALILYSSQLLY